MSNSAARELVTWSSPAGEVSKHPGDGNLPTPVFSTAAAMEAED
jgi:hypothetical protein